MSVSDYDYLRTPGEVILRWRFHDGGRRAAGFPPHGDCGVRAGSIATGIPYIDVYRALANLDRRPEWTGTRWEVMNDFLADHGFAWTPASDHGVRLRADHLPHTSPLVVRATGHLVAVVNGELRDTFDCSRGGRRRVLGWWERGA